MGHLLAQRSVVVINVAAVLDFSFCSSKHRDKFLDFTDLEGMYIKATSVD